MNTKRYAYSLNGSDWRGNFNSRKEARQAALDAVKEQTEPAREVYVGQMIPADPQASGHARNIIREINRRADAAGVGDYLSGLKVDQVEDLDREVANVIFHWLLRHRLEPTNFTVNAISEYPVPLPPEVRTGPTDEVADLGQSRELETLQ
jgi:hypothetical protein